MMETFDFGEALAYIRAGMVVSNTINGIERRYYLNGDGNIVCTPNGKPHLTYVVNTMHVDSILSDNWKLCD